MDNLCLQNAKNYYGKITDRDKIICSIVASVNDIKDTKKYADLQKEKFILNWIRYDNILLLATEDRLKRIDKIIKELIDSYKEYKKTNLIKDLNTELEAFYKKIRKDFEDKCGNPIVKFAKDVGDIEDKEKWKYKVGFENIRHYEDHYLETALITLAYSGDFNLSVASLLHDTVENYPMMEQDKIYIKIEKLLTKTPKISKKAIADIIKLIRMMTTTEFKKEFGMTALKEKIKVAETRLNKKQINEARLNKELYRSVYKLQKMIENSLLDPRTIIIDLANYMSNVDFSESIKRDGHTSVMYFIEETIYVLSRFFEMNKDNKYLKDKEILKIADMMHKDIEKNISMLTDYKEIMKFYKEFKRKAEVVESYY